MAPDLTILHLVENNCGVHTIKPQLRLWDSFIRLSDCTFMDFTSYWCERQIIDELCV